MNLKRKTDYAEFGGAPLLGVNGITMICHGRSSAKAIKNAIRRAKGMAEGHVHELIQRDIEESHSQPPAEEKDMKACIAGTGSYAPARVLTNADLERMVATSDEWIRERTGIRERRIAATGEACSDLAVQAGNGR